MDTHILYVPSCYDHMNAQRKKSALQGSGLVRTVGLCAQRVAMHTVGRVFIAISIKCELRGFKSINSQE